MGRSYYNCSKHSTSQTGLIFLLSFPTASLKADCFYQIHPGATQAEMKARRFGLCSRCKKWGKINSSDQLDTTNDRQVLIKNNNPVITTQVPRWELDDFQGFRYFIKGCSLDVRKHFRIFLAGVHIIIDTSKTVRVFQNMVYICFAEAQMPHKRQSREQSCPKN